MITGAYTVFESIGDCGPEYFEKFYIAMDDRKLLSPLYSGLRNTIPPSRFLATRTPVPPPDEQAAIVRFLDHADRRIRRYIRVKRQLITLLNEQKQAIIHRAVTRGLDPNVRLKPSGVEWLGDVPEHWSLRRFKFATTITSGQVDPRRVEYRDQILIAPNHIESGTGRITCEETADAQGADSGKYQVRRGQVIYSKIRPNLRKAAIAPKDCLCSADMYPITPRPNQLTGDYLLLLMLSAPFTKYTVDCSMRVAMPKINREALGECWLWFPSIEEQRSIIARVNEQTGAYFDATQKIQHEVGLMLEYRTRLYADVVTGKLDVREAAARLPEGVKEGDAVTEDLLDDEEVADDTELDAEPEEVEV
jgi:type I restriction enzyme S subunit